ncbi:MFS transporter [Paraburkholderia tuberum]|uniref:MFS transporter, AAHS family, 4-hydroxybenzoate transporter n=1 Tax=Paraburkholderia tuberum TaxID=157910 RepID=A0A1H1KF93_9BURK|nr:MFS transporter [Paraburkholderia tuberum]SDR60886.1 MFS transporter, AAHS family, 4-hydroxybenzoate transporter [Paraburkholderia tuberum]
MIKAVENPLGPGNPGTSTASSRNVQDIIDSHELSFYQISVVACCVIVLLLDGFDAVMIAYVAPVLIKVLGITPGQLGPLFSAGLAGLTVGAFLCGPLADKFGRKPVLVASILIFGGFTLATAAANTLTWLIVLRFAAGVGLGGAGPSAMALVAELSPTRLRASQIAWLGCGIPVGGAVAGFAAAKLIPAFGWTSMFVVGGALPLLVAIVVAVWVPESIRFLLVRPGNDARARRILARIAPDFSQSNLQLSVGRTSENSGTLRDLVGNGLGVSTVLLWIAAFCMLLVVYFLTNWLPVLFRTTHYTMSETSILLGLFLVGSPVGSLSIGYLMDRINRYLCMAVTAFIAAICFIIIGRVTEEVAFAGVTIFFLGASCGACVTGTSILASFIYPGQIRATGIGWTNGFARVGSIVGAMCGGILLASGVSLSALLQLVSLPCFIAVVAFLFLKGTVGRYQRSRQRSDPLTPQVLN